MNATGKRARHTSGNRYDAKRKRRQGNPNRLRYLNRGNLSTSYTENPNLFPEVRWVNYRDFGGNVRTVAVRDF